MKNELNIVYLIRTLRKLQAGVSALVASDNDVMKKAKHLYLNSCSINANLAECESKKSETK